MTTVDEIKSAIEKLSPSERAKLEQLLHPDADDDWDRQMIADAKSGKLDRIIAKLDASSASGSLRELP